MLWGFNMATTPQKVYDAIWNKLVTDKKVKVECKAEAIQKLRTGLNRSKKSHAEMLRQLGDSPEDIRDHKFSIDYQIQDDKGFAEIKLMDESQSGDFVIL